MANVMTGIKRYNTMSNVGTAKYLVNFHNGISKHNDGSDFFDMRTFKNKKKMDAFIIELYKNGYIEAKPDIYL